MGVATFLDTNFSGAGSKLPLAGQDEILTENAGSLWLFDVAHTFGGMGDNGGSPGGDAYLPINGQPHAIPNVAWDKGGATLGFGGYADLAGRVGASFLGSDIKFERTARKGLHGACSRANMQDSRGVAIMPGVTTVNYIQARPTNRYYLSLWLAITRGTSAEQPLCGIVNFSGPYLNNLLLYSTSGNRGAELPGIPSGGLATAGTNVSGVAGLRAGGCFRPTGGVPADPANLIILAAVFGAYGPFGSSSRNDAASLIFYRSYCEDLSVSGRAYQDVEDLDMALFRREFAVGGRFYGDVWTNPATLIA